MRRFTIPRIISHQVVVTVVVSASQHRWCAHTTPIKESNTSSVASILSLSAAHPTKGSATQQERNGSVDKLTDAEAAPMTSHSEYLHNHLARYALINGFGIDAATGEPLVVDKKATKDPDGIGSEEYVFAPAIEESQKIVSTPSNRSLQALQAMEDPAGFPTCATGVKLYAAGRLWCKPSPNIGNGLAMLEQMVVPKKNKRGAATTRADDGPQDPSTTLSTFQRTELHTLWTYHMQPLLDHHCSKPSAQPHGDPTAPLKLAANNTTVLNVAFTEAQKNSYLESGTRITMSFSKTKASKAADQLLHFTATHHDSSSSILPRGIFHRFPLTMEAFAKAIEIREQNNTAAPTSSVGMSPFWISTADLKALLHGYCKDHQVVQQHSSSHVDVDGEMGNLEQHYTQFGGFSTIFGVNPRPPQHRSVLLPGEAVWVNVNRIPFLSSGRSDPSGGGVNCGVYPTLQELVHHYTQQLRCHLKGGTSSKDTAALPPRHFSNGCVFPPAMNALLAKLQSQDQQGAFQPSNLWAPHHALPSAHPLKDVLQNWQQSNSGSTEELPDGILVAADPTLPWYLHSATRNAARHCFFFNVPVPLRSFNQPQAVWWQPPYNHIRGGNPMAVSLRTILTKNTSVIIHSALEDVPVPTMSAEATWVVPRRDRESWCGVPAKVLLSMAGHTGDVRDGTGGAKVRASMLCPGRDVLETKRDEGAALSHEGKDNDVDEAPIKASPSASHAANDARPDTPALIQQANAADVLGDDSGRGESHHDGGIKLRETQHQSTDVDGPLDVFGGSLSHIPALAAAHRRFLSHQLGNATSDSSRYWLTAEQGAAFGVGILPTEAALGVKVDVPAADDDRSVVTYYHSTQTTLPSAFLPSICRPLPIALNGTPYPLHTAVKLHRITAMFENVFAVSQAELNNETASASGVVGLLTQQPQHQVQVWDAKQRFESQNLLGDVKVKENAIVAKVPLAAGNTVVKSGKLHASGGKFSLKSQNKQQSASPCDAAQPLAQIGNPSSAPVQSGLVHLVNALHTTNPAKCLLHAGNAAAKMQVSLTPSPALRSSSNGTVRSTNDGTVFDYNRELYHHQQQAVPVVSKNVAFTATDHLRMHQDAYALLTPQEQAILGAELVAENAVRNYKKRMIAAGKTQRLSAAHWIEHRVCPQCNERTTKVEEGSDSSSDASTVPVAAQRISHLLNGCKSLLSDGQYLARHNAVLCAIAKQLLPFLPAGSAIQLDIGRNAKSHLLQELKHGSWLRNGVETEKAHDMTATRPAEEDPEAVVSQLQKALKACTPYRPDMIIAIPNAEGSKTGCSYFLLELSVSGDVSSSFTLRSAHAFKANKYRLLPRAIERSLQPAAAAVATPTKHTIKLYPVEVGSRGSVVSTLTSAALDILTTTHHSIDPGTAKRIAYNVGVAASLAAMQASTSIVRHQRGKSGWKRLAPKQQVALAVKPTVYGNPSRWGSLQNAAVLQVWPTESVGSIRSRCKVMENSPLANDEKESNTSYWPTTVLVSRSSTSKKATAGVATDGQDDDDNAMEGHHDEDLVSIIRSVGEM